MRNYKNVLKHINKQELSTEKIELGLVDDAEQFIKQAETLMQNIKKDGDQYIRLRERLLDLGYTLTGKIYDALESNKKRLEKSAKDIGINIPQVAQIDKTLNDIRVMRKRYNF